MEQEVIKFTINLAPRTKKNSQRIALTFNKRTGKRDLPIILPSELYKDYEKSCRVFMPLNVYPIETPVNVKCIYYMPTRRRVDLTNLLESTDDILVYYHILSDDNRDIIASHDGSRVYYDKENPRTEIEITPMENYEQWKAPKQD